MEAGESRWRQLLDELKRRRVIRVATLYVIAFWPIIQIADILSPAIGLPPVAMRYILIAFLGGLPIVLILAWVYDLNKGGVVRSGEAQAPQQALISRTAELVIVGFLIVIIAVLFFLQDVVTFDDPPPLSDRSTTQPASTATSTHAIAVLPFASFSEKREDELFSDGLTEELLNVLSQINRLRVTARTTSFAYKGVNRNVQEIGEELNVDTILEGSVRRNDIDNRIRVTAQLIDVATGSHLWSNTFDREFRDVFKIQDEIASAVVGQLQITLVGEESARMQTRVTADTEALVAYSMGRASLAKRTRSDLADAARFFERAIATDPGYVAAYAELANAYALQSRGPADEAGFLAMAQTNVDKALDLDPESGSAWAAQGLIHMHYPDRQDEAREVLKKAIELNPSLAIAHMWYGNVSEDEEERRRYHARAFELDPRSPVAGYNLASDLIRVGRVREAMDVFSKIVEADPHYPRAYELIGSISEFRGRLADAIRHYEKVYAMEPTGGIAAKLATLSIDIGDFEKADRWLQHAEADASPEHASEIAWLKIGSYVARGERERAEAMMRPLLTASETTLEAYLDKIRAGYYLADYAATVTAYEAARDLAPERMDADDASLPEVHLAAAFAYRQLDQPEKGDEVLVRTIDRLDALTRDRERIAPDTWFIRAQVQAIRGEPNLALLNLQRAVDEGWRQHWRPFVEPCLQPLQTNPAFITMMQGLATRMDLIREQIAFDAEFDSNWNI